MGNKPIQNKNTGKTANKAVNSKNNSTGSNTSTVNKGFNKYLIPLIVVLAVVPLIVFLKMYIPNLSEYAFFIANPGQYMTDLFLYYKAVILIIAAAVMAGIIIVQCIRKKKAPDFPRIFIPLAAYMLLSLLSAIFSKTPYFCFNGIYEQFESVWVLLGYGMVAYYASVIITNARDTDILVNFLTVSTVIILLLGIGQAFSADFFRTGLFSDIASLGVPKDLNITGSLEFNFPVGRVYLTMYNPNYVGSYAALVSPVFLMIAISKRKPLLIVLNLLIFVGIILELLASGSRAGLAGIAVSLLLLVVIFFKQVWKYKMEALIILVLIVGTIYTMNNYSNNEIFNRVKNMLNFEETVYPLSDITVNEDNVVINYNSKDITVNYITDAETGAYGFSVLDDTGEALSLSYDEETHWFSITDSGYSFMKVGTATISDYPSIIVKLNGKDWPFSYIDGELYYYNYLGRFDKINNSDTFAPFAKYGNLASGRGYIWSKTMPILMDNISLGTGPDTFMLNYPNDDYVDQYNHGYGEELMTKPHSMYLQIGVQTGLISLICVLVFYFWYFLSSLKILAKSDKRKPLTMLGTGILCGTFGYMIIGLTNDSTVSVAPIFWALTGVGIAINKMLKKELPVQAEQAEVNEAASLPEAQKQI